MLAQFIVIPNVLGYNLMPKRAFYEYNDFYSTDKENKVIIEVWCPRPS